MTNLLKETEYIYNHVKYQDRDGYVNTCGSHVVHRLYRLKNDGMDLKTFYEFMKSIKDEFAINYDLVAAEFINKWFWAAVDVHLFTIVASSLIGSTLVWLSPRVHIFHCNSNI